MPDGVRTALVNYVRICYPLEITVSGNGSVPSASSSDFDECANGYYAAGEIISLSGADPDNGWEINSWTGTDDNDSTSSSNTVTMPADEHSAGVIYNEIDTPPPPPTPTPDPYPEPEPEPICSVTVSLYSTGEFKASWEIKNTGDQDLRLDWLSALFPYFPNEYGNLVGVAFEDPIWAGSVSSPATIETWNEGVESDRYLSVGQTKLLAFTFEKKGRGYEPHQLNVELPSIDDNECKAVETWESGD
jgi:hypothetical protein